MEVKFVWNGIKVDGKLFRVWYSDSELIGNYPKGTLTIYRKDYGNMPDVPGLNVQNDTDMMTDYFERDRIRIYPDNQHYPAIMEATKQAKAHNDKRWAKRYA